MADVPWWYSVVHEWRQRAFVETHHWPPNIAMTMNAQAMPIDGLASVPAVTRVR